MIKTIDIDPIDIVLLGVFGSFSLGVWGVINHSIDLTTLTLITSGAGAAGTICMKLIKDSNCNTCMYKEFANANPIEFQEYRGN